MNLYYCRYHKRKSKKAIKERGATIYVPDELDIIFKDGDKLIGKVVDNKFILARDEDVVNI